MNAVADKARANKVKLPDKFYLGFDEFASALPNEAAAPLLGQELVQIEWLVNSLLDARVESVNAFRRTPLPEERESSTPLPTPVSAAGAKPASTAAAAAKLFERNVVEATFVSTPAAARKVINQIAGANQHFCIIRLLQVRNEKDKGPPREAAETTTNAPSIPAPVPAVSPGAKPAPGRAEFHRRQRTGRDNREDRDREVHILSAMSWVDRVPRLRDRAMRNRRGFAATFVIERRSARSTDPTEVAR